MKSTEDTFGIIQDIIKALPIDLEIALVGGYAAILHGVERTTLDIDFCIHYRTTDSDSTDEIYEQLQKTLPGRFKATLIRGSAIPDDPFKHDVIFIEDSLGEYLRIDFLIARYNWELEAIQAAGRVEGIPAAVVTKPYLAAFKLKATGHKDASDLVTLVKLMTESEKQETLVLAKRIGRDRKLTRLLSPSEEELDEESSEELI